MIEIVVVEDFDILREDIIETLESVEQYEVIGDFDNGEDSVKFIIREKPDLVLMDIEMESPKAGIVAAREIIDKLPNLKLLFLTAYEDEELIIEAMETGAVDYILKDDLDNRLLEHVENALGEEVNLHSKVQKTLMDEYTRLRLSERSLLFFINNVGKLTPAEFEIVNYLLDGKTNREIAEARTVELATVKSQVRSLLNKFGCTRRKEIVDMIKTLELEYLFKNR